MSEPTQTELLIRDWYAALPKQRDGLPPKGSMAGALVVLEQLKNAYELDIAAHMAEGNAQIKGHTPSAVKKILAVFGENRLLLAEGGRTNRGAPGAVRDLLKALRSLGLDRRSEVERNLALKAMQRFLVVRIGEYHRLERVKLTFDPAMATRFVVHDLLVNAKKVGKDGPVAQHLVGAKLALRFPGLTISNERASAADAPGKRLGDFEIGNTAFHVTVSPASGVFEKCKSNLKGGTRVYLLVPEGAEIGARQNAEGLAPCRIAVESIESFVATNIEELAEFAQDRLVSGLRRLLEKYNERVDAVELDKSLLIEIPRNLT